LHVVGSRFFSDIQVTGMTDMSVHQQQDWFRTTARFHNGKKVFEPLGKNALSDTAGLAGLSYCTISDGFSLARGNINIGGINTPMDDAQQTAVTVFALLCSRAFQFGQKKFRFDSILATESVFTARCYASAVLAMALCLSVCLSVRHKPVFY